MSVFSIPFDEMEVGINHFCTSECLWLSQREKLWLLVANWMSFFFFLNEIPTIVTWNKDWRINYGYWNSQILENIFFTTHKESLTLQDKQLTGCVAKPNARGAQADHLTREVDAQNGMAVSASFTSTVSAGDPAAGLQVARGQCLLLCSACRWHGVRTVYAAALLLKPPASSQGAESGRQRLTLISSVELGNVSV